MEVEAEDTLKIIYPTSIKKYIGYITEYRRKNGTLQYNTRVKYGEHNWGSSYASYEEAFECIKEYNIVNNLPITNIIYEKEDYLEVKLTKGQVCKVDKDDIDIIQMYSFHATYNVTSSAYYATSRVNKSHTQLHNLLMNHIPDGEITVDHIDRDSLNNRRENLRLATQREQILNQKLRRDNTSNLRGVSYDKTNGAWIAFWTDVNRKHHHRYFSVNKYGYERAKKLATNERLLRHGSTD